MFLNILTYTLLILNFCFIIYMIINEIGNIKKHKEKIASISKQIEEDSAKFNKTFLELQIIKQEYEKKLDDINSDINKSLN